MKTLITLLLAATSAFAIPFPGPPISPTATEFPGLSNSVLTAKFARDDNGVRLASLQSPLNGLDLAWNDPNLFTIYLSSNPKPLTSSAMKRAGADQLSATFTDEATGLRVDWRAFMADGANYLRQEVKLRATRDPVGVDRIEMIRASVPGAKVTGYTDGAPITNDKLFLGIEHPMAQNTVKSFNGWTPAEMAARQFDVPVVEMTDGELVVTFDYQKGNHRIDVAQLALVDATGKTLAVDAHAGFSGNANSRNTYRLAVPAGVAEAKLRVQLGGVPTETDSWGKITVTGAKVEASSKVVCSLPRQCTLEPGTMWTVTSGIGVYPAGQLRRAFLYYLERERAHPYRQYWHYNSWYDLNIGFNDKPDPIKRMNEQQCLDVIRAFGTELHEKRGVGLDGFVWDDGWDDWNSLWDFHKGFPNGFAKLKEEAAKQGAGMGAWLSPWGGYGGSHKMRVACGKSKGYETNSGGFSLGGPKYYAAYRDRCVQFIRDYNMNYFKFDGIGGGMYATGAPASIAPDLDNLVRLLRELRQADPDVFINCTVGTWASPYWTWFADSVWRQGDDCSYTGEGNARERWITYRDDRIYTRFANPSPLYPLNSMMYHGLLVGPRDAPAAMPKPAQNIESYRHEVMMSVGCGSGLGELYVTPSLMTPEAWDILAEGLKWSRTHSDILCDTHWVGGHPVKEVYGYAAWHPSKGATIALRNPTGKEQTFVLNPQQIFELPANAPRSYKFAPALNSKIEPLRASADKPATLTLQPFQVVLMEATPEK